MATWVRNSELQLESGLLWIPWGGMTITFTLGLGRLLGLLPDPELCGQWKYSVGHSGVFRPAGSLDDGWTQYLNYPELKNTECMGVCWWQSE